MPGSEPTHDTWSRPSSFSFAVRVTGTVRPPSSAAPSTLATVSSGGSARTSGSSPPMMSPALALPWRTEV